MDRLIVPRRGHGAWTEVSQLPFQISQRADHIVNDFFEWVQQNRAIVNTRDEPLADPNQYRRIHLLLGDSNMAEYATALKLGTTGLVLQLIEDGQAPSGLEIDEPVETLQEISQDQEREWLVGCNRERPSRRSTFRKSFWLRATPITRAGRRNRLGTGSVGNRAPGSPR